MATELTGALRGDPARRAVLLAGALAEAGVLELVLTAPDGHPRAVRARETNLPGELLGAKPGSTLANEAMGLRVSLDIDGWRWTARDAATARALAALSN